MSKDPGSEASVESPDGDARVAPMVVVGLGASAGGLEALREFLAATPAESEPAIAYVVVTHQSEGSPNLLPDLLKRHTAMPVQEIMAPVTLEPGHVYLPRPGWLLVLVDGILTPVRPQNDVMARHPIDFFFRSLAHALRDHAIGVVLSGTGSDGTLGIKEIKAGLGTAIVQEQSSARFAGMPQSALSAGFVDFVLPPADMPARIQAVATTARQHPPQQDALAREPWTAFQPLFHLLRTRTGHDFGSYKERTVRRRVERRLQLHRIDGLDEYVRFLRGNPGEIDVLFQELLIRVTSFFRDPDAFEVLRESLQRQLASRPADHVVRAWVAGCSTGEEAYSIAILVQECLEQLERPVVAQIFATDLHEGAIAFTRAAVYPEGIATDLSAERLARHFIRDGETGTYRVNKRTRELVVFASHSVLRDPPFTRLDLITCRNLLIYLNAEAQAHLLPVFHYALAPGGLLFLGPSEAVTPGTSLFRGENHTWRIFAREDGSAGEHIRGALSSDALRRERRGGPRPAPPRRTEADSGSSVAQLLLTELVPPTIIIHDSGRITHIHGRTGQFLEPAPGPQAPANLFEMAREGLRGPLIAAVRSATEPGAESVQPNLRVRTNGSALRVDLRVRRIPEPSPLAGLLLVSFDRARPDENVPAGRDAVQDAASDALHEELEQLEESHRRIIKELEDANEELKSTNEELQSTNEELQSANEELGTSREEMQSLNEELQTVNAELQSKVEELSVANDDMKNLLNGTDIGMLFLDDELRIQRFTEQAKRVLPLRASDVGRSLGDLLPRLHHDGLLTSAAEVLRSLVATESEVEAQDGSWYLMRILPYRTVDNVIDGLVLTFVDITKLRRLERDSAQILGILAGSPSTLSTQDTSLRYTWVSQSLYGILPERVVGLTDSALLGDQVAAPITELKRSCLETGVDGRRIVRVEEPSGPCWHQIIVRPEKPAAGVTRGIACVTTRFESLTMGEEVAK